MRRLPGLPARGCLLRSVRCLAPGARLVRASFLPFLALCPVMYLASPAQAVDAALPRVGPASHAARSAFCPADPMEVTASGAAAVYALAGRKLSAAARQDPGRYPFGALRGNPQYQRTSATAWTSGFFPGSLWLMYEQSASPGWLDRARNWTSGLLPVARFRGTHDLGFMVGIPTSLGYRLDPRPASRTRYAQAEARAARTLARRWNPRVGAIKSSEYGNAWGVIVDSAMNAPMLIEVADRIGGEAGARLHRIGVAHMRTLARDFIRADGSTFHRQAYDPRSGRLLRPIPGQGLDARTSTWARGQAWAMAGFAEAYALTGDPQFLDAAQRTAAYWVQHVPAGCVPAWDLDVGNPSAPRDSSAAAIAAYGMLLLAQALDEATADSALPDASGPDASGPEASGTDTTESAPEPTQAEVLRTHALTTLGTLASPAWTTAYSANPGLLRRQTLSVPADPREGTYVWGDFYLLGALRQALASGRLAP